MQFKITTIIAAAAFLPWSASAAPPAPAPAPADFAHTAPLETAPGHAVYGLAVSKHVYAGVTRADLGDLRVFDADGVAMQHALCAAEQAAKSPERVWIMAAPGPRWLEEENSFLYQINSLAPVAQAQLGLPEENLRLKVSISSRNADDAAWQERSSGWFRGVKEEQDAADALPSGFTPGPGRQWRVQILQGAQSLGGRRPALRVGYRPAELRFRAEGEPPYRLAYGSASAEPAPVLACSDLPADQIGVARMAAPLPAARTEPTASEPAAEKSAGKRARFWGALAGVAIIAALAAAVLLRRRRRAGS